MDENIINEMTKVGEINFLSGLFGGGKNRFVVEEIIKPIFLFSHKSDLKKTMKVLCFAYRFSQFKTLQDCSHIITELNVYNRYHSSVVCHPISVTSKTDFFQLQRVKQLKETIEIGLKKEVKKYPTLIIVDCFHLCHSADEHSNKEMKNLFANIREVFFEEPNSYNDFSFLFIDHTEGVRNISGSYIAWLLADNVYRLSRENNKLTLVKEK